MNIYLYKYSDLKKIFCKNKCIAMKFLNMYVFMYCMLYDCLMIVQPSQCVFLEYVSLHENADFSN